MKRQRDSGRDRVFEGWKYVGMERGFEECKVGRTEGWRHRRKWVGKMKGWIDNKMKGLRDKVETREVQKDERTMGWWNNGTERQGEVGMEGERGGVIKGGRAA